MIITDAGQALLARALRGDTLTFTAVQMGDGSLTTQTMASMSALVNRIISLPIGSITCADNTATIVSNFSNIVTDTFTGDGQTKTFTLSAFPASLSTVTVAGTASTDYTYTASSGRIVFGTAPVSGALIGVGYNMAAFNWREIGVFAADPDHPTDRTKDILYCYQNAGTEPYPIPAPAPTPYTETLTIKIYIAQAQNVTITVASGLTAASIAFDPTGTSFSATTVRGALIELYTKLEEAEITVDDALSATSENPVQNKAVKAALDGKAASAHTHGNLANDGTLSAAAAGADAGTGIQPVFAGTDAKLGVVTIAQAQQALKIPLISAAQAALPVAGWSEKAQTVSVAGVKAGSKVIVQPDPSCYLAWQDANVYCSAQSAGSLTFACDDTPTAALTANVLIVEVAE